MDGGYGICRACPLFLPMLKSPWSELSVSATEERSVIQYI
ncbi:hypothetical protein LINGRAHAP2_LOCUS4786 [Linum grandiflorum]